MSRKNLQNIKLKNSILKTKPFFNQEGFVAGIPPFLRGPYSTMYIQKPWVTRHFSGFSTAEDSNYFYREQLKKGQTELSILFDNATNKGYDSDHKNVQEVIGKKGVAIDSVEDIKVLFYKIPLDKISVFIKTDINFLPILAFYIAAAEEQNINTSDLSLTIESNILKNSNLYSASIITDVFEYSSKNKLDFNYSISDYSSLETVNNPEKTLAFSLTEGLEFLRKAIEAGINIDDIAPKLSYSWSINMNHFAEIAKIRAARMLWAKMVKQFDAKNSESFILKSHCKTSDSSLTQQDPFNNITRVTTEAMAAIFGGTQSLHTNALDETFALPSEVSAQVAKDTQIYLQKETNITQTVDPWAGSYHLENLTEDLANKAWKLICKIEESGGISNFFENGTPKTETKNTNNDTKIGVNKYQLEKEDPLTFLEIDGKAVQDLQIKKLDKLKPIRNNLAVKESLNNISKAIKHQKGNLLELTIIAAKYRATLEEISNALLKE
ncbi:methylmalonyl-CoA mutase family protein [Polaribacter sargassicola]|uniref:methylmalonyl-CoA mutase family protein n=1 Tax=Polaribacter sargassicola TaxID=2836891 RepID=UPI001F21002D|nr:methylmalonyl-CoA mutase family protein [Polaribacter sp. DS7-9]MCG1037405.1 methylmalonyl-CoA mutase [Polaribacter sp. DS7-9]